ncbi:acyl-CoA N-acyltransferase [Piptocephalis cylindrospora]|uniref:Glucosamine 6-phosphate N-acetyltransferase n=1 Tax=Piptocephalis cylindrospora TaxID=1907219 RepID=A0A4P9Y0A3_9FUNG|nr:acyl-CoA N-acyltransferase [Piptocephalis cylindrospora]|eukprot:RKP11882.1 acyl-CoA N-acyltransferase [Piptocephalis cylindrospora]
MSDLLFPPHLISPSVQKALPKGYHMRPLSSADFEKGFLEALSHLTDVGSPTKASFIERFAYMKTHNHEYFTLVIEHTERQKIVAAGTIFVERKFIRGNGLVGHIEDIVVHESARGLQFGRYIIEALKYVGASTSCYKIILDCSEKNVPFYVKCGFKQNEVKMAWYIPKEAERALPLSKL